jgi:class 3 adenylate cyclase
MSNPLPQTIARFIVSADLEDSTTLVAKVGDLRWQEISRDHNLLVRRLISQFGGEEFGRTDGFLVLFERASDSLRFSLSYHEALQRFASEGGVALGVRVGIHLGEVVIHETTAEEQSVGARSREVDGLGVNIAVRLMALARGGQTLLTRGVYDLAQRGVVGDPEYADGVEWLAHGPYLFQGMEDAFEVYEAGRRGYAPLKPPADSSKARRVLRPGEEEMLGWRPVPGASAPRRERWILERKLGEGGFGEAWLARFAKTRESRVFKFCFDPDRLRGLKREVTLFRVLKETLGKRDDIAPILEWNFDGAPYFIESDYTDGGDLKDWAESTAAKDAPLELRLRLVAEIASAVGVAHSVGVIHKDIKPSNVLIYSGQDGQPRARLTDFGIGLIMDRALLGVAGVTETGLTDASILANHSSRTGTRLFTAPELIEGKPPTIQSDIYALGVMLYQLVVGDVNRSLTGDWRDDITDDLLREDIAACVAGDPVRRLTSAEELAARLRELQTRRADRDARRREQEQIEATRRALESAKARRKVLTLVSVVATTVIAALSLLYFQAEQQRSRAEQERGRAEAAAKEASEQRTIAKANEEKAIAQQKAAETARDATDHILGVSSVQLANFQLRENRSDLALTALSETPARLRNWDWGYARALINSELATLEGHLYNVNSAAWSPDGTRIVTASNDNTARVWDSATGKSLATLQGHTEPVNSAAFSPDGTRIVTASYDKTARVWEAAPWREVPGSPNSDGLPIEDQFRLWKLKRYRDWQVRQIQDKPDSALGGKTREVLSREITQKFKDAYPDWAKWFCPEPLSSAAHCSPGPCL